MIRNTFPSKCETDAIEPLCSQPPRQKPTPLSSIESKRRLSRSPVKGLGRLQKGAEMFSIFFHKKQRGYEFNLAFSGESQGGNLKRNFLGILSLQSKAPLQQRRPGANQLRAFPGELFRVSSCG